jgi:hypothetical protein
LIEAEARILPVEPLYFNDNKPLTGVNADWSNFTKEKKFCDPAHVKKYLFVYPQRESDLAKKFLAKFKEVIILLPLIDMSRLVPD